MLVEQFCKVIKNGKELKLSLSELGKQPILSLIWFNNGLWGIISKEKIANVIAGIQDQEKLPVLDRKKDIGKFYWDEVEVIPPKIAKLLFGEKK